MILNEEKLDEKVRKLPHRLQDRAKAIFKEKQFQKDWRHEDSDHGLWENRDFILEAIEMDPSALQFASWDLQDDPVVVLAALRKTGHALQWASSGLRADKDLVLEAVRMFGEALAYASVGLRADKRLVLEAVTRRGGMLEYASEELRADKEVVHEAVVQHGPALRYASSTLRADADIVLAAVKNYGFALQHTSDELRGNKDVVLAAVRQTGYALKYASEELRGNEEVVMEAVRHGGATRENATREIRGNKDIALAAAREILEDDNWCLDFDDGTLPGVFLEALADAGIDKEGADSAIAMAGEIAPVLSVTVTHLPSSSPSSSSSTAASFHCEVLLLSGTSFSFNMPVVENKHNPERPGPNLKSLATKLIGELPKHMEVHDGWYYKRVFVNFQINDDGDTFCATPWDWNRPLSEFVAKSL